MFFVALVLGLPPAAAHEIRPAIVTITFTADKLFDIEIQANMEAVIAGVSPRHVDTDESPNARTYNELRALPAEAFKDRIVAFMPRLLGGITIEFDGRRVTPVLARVDVPAPGDPALARLSTVRLRGEVPTDAKTFRWTYAGEFGSNVLRVRRPGADEIFAVWLKEGVASEPLSLTGDLTKSRTDVMWEYIVLGFTHILPKGLDHILFVVGLFLFSARFKPLLLQVTAFTVAHSITLGLSIYGVVSLSPAIVEPLIAASIVYVAIENVLTNQLKPWRVFVVFGFGLLHGMGFAGVLNEVGLPRSEFLTGLIAFNLGVEFGQLAVIGLAYAAVGIWGRGKNWYRAGVVVPVSVAIAVIGFYWTVERVLV